MGETSGTGEQQKLFIYKTGLLGGTPLDFMAKLADEIGAVYLSKDRIREQQLEKRQKGLRLPKNLVKRVFESQAETVLKTDDVVAEILLNTRDSRLIGSRLAAKTDCEVMALDIKTTDRIAEERVKFWTKVEAFELPLDKWDKPPLDHLKIMRHTIQPPTTEEGIDYIVEVDGDNDNSDELVDFVFDKMEDYGLIDAD